jgi:hypothetical protein
MTIFRSSTGLRDDVRREAGYCGKSACWMICLALPSVSAGRPAPDAHQLTLPRPPAFRSAILRSRGFDNQIQCHEFEAFSKAPPLSII